MKRLLRSIRRRLLYWTNAKTVTIDGIRIITEKGFLPESVRDLLFRDTYEDTERNLLKKILKPGMKVVEIGAGIGFIGLLAARAVGASNVFCYEANPELEPILRRHHALNELAPTLTMRAVTRDGRPISFFKSDNIISSSVYDRNQAGRQITVQSMAFRDVLEQCDPDVLVIDVEGAEIELLTEPDFKNVKHIIVELHPHIVGEDKIRALIQQLTNRNYSLAQRDRKTSYFRAG